MSKHITPVETGKAEIYVLGTDEKVGEFEVAFKFSAATRPGEQLVLVGYYKPEGESIDIGRATKFDVVYAGQRSKLLEFGDAPISDSPDINLVTAIINA
jgi:hypothetical protein